MKLNWQTGGMGVAMVWPEGSQFALMWDGFSGDVMSGHRAKDIWRRVDNPKFAHAETMKDFKRLAVEFFAE